MYYHSKTKYPEVSYTFLGHGGATLVWEGGVPFNQCDCGAIFPTVQHVEGDFESPEWVRHARAHRRRLLKLNPDELALCETLLTAQRTANSLDGLHAHQAGGTYGAVRSALLTALGLTILGSHPEFFFVDVQALAQRLYDEAIDNGENLAYQVNLYNEGVI